MPRAKAEQAEVITPKLREVEVELGRGKTVAEAVKKLGPRITPALLSLEYSRHADPVAGAPGFLVLTHDTVIQSSMVMEPRSGESQYPAGSTLGNPIRHLHFLRQNTLRW